MIIQELFWDNQKFFTIIHKGMDQGIEERIIQKSIKILNYEIKFKEHYIEEYRIEDENYNYFINGFLGCKNEKNPYENYSTYYKEYIYPNNNTSINELSFKDFKKLYDFIKEYTNFQFTKSNINNIIFFYPTKVLVKHFNSETYPYLIIESSENINLISVKFKLNDIILESINLTDIPKDKKIYSNTIHNNYEIEIFDNDKILYKDYASIISSIDFNITTVTNSKEIKLNKFDKTIISSDSKTEKFTISNKTELSNISTYLSEETRDRNELNNLNKNDCVFLKKDEREKAYTVLENLIKKEGELFIFDPYFLKESKGKDVLKDLITIILTNNNPINIIYSKYKGESFENFKNNLSAGEILYFKYLGIKKIQFIDAKEDFHDRFIFLKKEEELIGYQIGTSLNSFGENYSNLVKLNQRCSEEIFFILKNDIISEEIHRIDD